MKHDTVRIWSLKRGNKIILSRHMHFGALVDIWPNNEIMIVYVNQLYL